MKVRVNQCNVGLIGETSSTFINSVRHQRRARPFSPFANGYLSFVSSSNERTTTSFRLHGLNGLNGLAHLCLSYTYCESIYIYNFISAKFFLHKFEYLSDFKTIFENILCPGPQMVDIVARPSLETITRSESSKSRVLPGFVELISSSGSTGLEMWNI